MSLASHKGVDAKNRFWGVAYHWIEKFSKVFMLLLIEKVHNRYESSSFLKEDRPILFLLSRAQRPPTNDARACQIPECKLGDNEARKTRYLALHRKSFNQIAIFLILFNNYVYYNLLKTLFPLSD